MDKVGGRAYKNGLRLMDGEHSVKVYYDNGDNLHCKLSSVRRGKLYRYLKKIPVIRGITGILLAIINFIREGVKNPRRYWVVFLIIALDIIYLLLPGGEGSGADYLFFLYILVPVILLIVYRRTIGEILRYHGAEHKAVNYYENSFEGDIASCSRLHRRCGSNVVFYYFLFSLGLGFFVSGVNIFVFELFCLGLAYEAVQYTPEWLLFFPQLFQRLVTREPGERHLRAAEKALEVLVQRK